MKQKYNSFNGLVFVKNKKEKTKGKKIAQNFGVVGMPRFTLLLDWPLACR